jgi:hypothetical protein
MHNLSVNDCKPVISPSKAIDQTFVVRAEEMKHASLQVVDVNCFQGDIIAKVVNFAQIFPGRMRAPAIQIEK